MSKHTPAPWFIGETLSDRGPCIVGDGDSVVCEFDGRAGGSLDADASLIAAAPDLLEACETLLFELVAGPACREEVIASARAAIAKATGAA